MFFKKAKEIPVFSFEKKICWYFWHKTYKGASSAFTIFSLIFGHKIMLKMDINPGYLESDCNFEIGAPFKGTLHFNINLGSKVSLDPT